MGAPYFYTGGVDNLASTAGNWWSDAAHTVPYGSAPVNNDTTLTILDDQTCQWDIDASLWANGVGAVCLLAGATLQGVTGGYLKVFGQTVNLGGNKTIGIYRADSGSGTAYVKCGTSGSAFTGTFQIQYTAAATSYLFACADNAARMLVVQLYDKYGTGKVGARWTWVSSVVNNGAGSYTMTNENDVSAVSVGDYVHVANAYNSSERVQVTGIDHGAKTVTATFAVIVPAAGSLVALACSNITITGASGSTDCFLSGGLADCYIRCGITAFRYVMSSGQPRHATGVEFAGVAYSVGNGFLNGDGNIWSGLHIGLAGTTQSTLTPSKSHIFTGLSTCTGGMTGDAPVSGPTVVYGGTVSHNYSILRNYAHLVGNGLTARTLVYGFSGLGQPQGGILRNVTVNGVIYLFGSMGNGVTFFRDLTVTNSTGINAALSGSNQRSAFLSPQIYTFSYNGTAYAKYSPSAYAGNIYSTASPPAGGPAATERWDFLATDVALAWTEPVFLRAGETLRASAWVYNPTGMTVPMVLYIADQSIDPLAIQPTPASTNLALALAYQQAGVNDAWTRLAVSYRAATDIMVLVRMFGAGATKTGYGRVAIHRQALGGMMDSF